MHGDAQDGAIDGGEAPESPILRVLHDDLGEYGEFFCSAFEQAVSERARGGGIIPKLNQSKRI